MFVLAHLIGALRHSFLRGFNYKKEGTLILYHSKRQISTKLTFRHPHITQMSQTHSILTVRIEIIGFLSWFLCGKHLLRTTQTNRRGANATNKSHSPNLRLRLHAFTYVSAD